jgi:hypothetical protein
MVFLFGLLRRGWELAAPALYPRFFFPNLDYPFLIISYQADSGDELFDAFLQVVGFFPHHAGIRLFFSQEYRAHRGRQG